MKIIAAHLLNDYSGSPKVLMQLIKGWRENGYAIDLYTSAEGDGFLSKIKDINYRFFSYKWNQNKIVRLINLCLSQLELFLKIFFNSKKGDLIYVNTVLPFGAAIAGKLKRIRVIYHIPETSVKPEILKWFLFKAVSWCADDIIFVSNYLASTQHLKGKKIHILHNAIENSFKTTADTNKTLKNEVNHILMISSLKEYKGVFEFVKIARNIPECEFTMVLNASKPEIHEFFKNIYLPQNLILVDRQSNVHPYYASADLVLNLSDKKRWVETFGLTVLEGMAYGNPAIVPTLGGVTELVDNGKNGFLIDGKNTSKIIQTIRTIKSNTDFYQTLRKNAYSTIQKFQETTFLQKNINIINYK